MILGFTPLLTKEACLPDRQGRGVVVRGTKYYFIDEGGLAQIEIPPYVYHAFWPLSNKPVVAVASGTTGYDPTDFVRPKINEVPRAIKILKKYKIKP